MPKYSRNVKIAGRSAQELYDVVAKDIDRFLSKTPLGEYELNRDPARREVSFKASMASMTLSFVDGEIQLNGSLGLMAMPFKGKLDEGIDRWLNKTFSAAPPAGQA